MANLSTDSAYPTEVLTSDAAVDGSNQTNVVRFSQRVKAFINSLTPSGATVYDTGWIVAQASAPTISYRRLGKDVTVYVDGAATLPSAATTTIGTTGIIPSDFRPPKTYRTGCYMTGFPGALSIDTTGTITVANQSGAARSSVGGYLDYKVD